MDTIATLQTLGFTEYEARAYAALVHAGALNGYELAKKTGIPRANIYAVAARLVERGAILPAEHAGGRGRRYVAVSPEQLLRSLEAQHKRALQAADAAFARQGPRPDETAVLNLRDDELLAQAQQLIDASQVALLLAIQPDEAGRLAASLQAARARGVHITTLCLQACEQACGGCQGEIHRRAIVAEMAEKTFRWLVVVADGQTALVGQIGLQHSEGLTTRQQVVVELASAFVRLNISPSDSSGAMAPVQRPVPDAS